jgi:RND family efflux transporter MFP subunit
MDWDLFFLSSRMVSRKRAMPPMRKIQKLIGHLAGLLFLCLLTGCGDSPAPGADAVSETEGEAPTVSVVKPERTTLRRTTTQPATVSAYFEADIYAKVAGYLTELKHDIGDTVEADATLGVVSVPEMDKQIERQQAEIRKLEADEKRAAAEVQVAKSMKTAADADLIQAQAEVAKTVALVAAYQRELDRTRDLVQRQSLAERLLDESQKRFESSEASQEAAEAMVTSARARLTVAESKIAAAKAEEDAAKAQTDVGRKQLEEIEALKKYATLSAPFRGVVTSRHVDVGDLVRNTQTASAGDRTPLFSVAQVETVRVQMAIPENDAPWANRDDPVSLKLRAVPGPAIEARITRVSGKLDPSTRTMLAEIELENTKREITLLPGMYGEATITLAERESLVLPAGVVRHDEKGKGYVYVVGADNTISQVEVTTGMDNGKQVEIQSGLKGNERIVTNMIERFTPGQKVNVQKSKLP